MKFQSNTRRKPIEYEKELVKYWREHKIFEKSVEQRPAADSYVFYDGPPFITGVPHHGTLLSSIIKDAVPRYWTMKGKRVERVWGWDCHGLPAESFTEKKLGITDKRDIGTKISLEDYIKACRQNMIQTGSEWEDTIARIGRWVDFKGAYKTMDKTYMESVWWAFKRLYEAGKIYEGEKVLLYCTRDATPISKAEVAMDNSYQEVTDPSVYVKFKLKNRMHKGRPVYLLAWTTTPWTLPANTALGVGPAELYVEVELQTGEVFIILAGLADKVLTDEKHQPVPYKIVRSGITGQQLIGQSYEPLFEDQGENAHKVWDYPGLSTGEGTGIVHLAPAYGEEDYQLAKQHGFPIISNVDDDGFYTSGEWQGQLIWDANKQIAKDLHQRGTVWKTDYVRHSYPHCWRCGTRLMYRVHPSWFMNVKAQEKLMLEKNQNINWYPAHFKKGRFAKNIQQAPDWNISRDRFWATAIPVWKGVDKDGHEHVKVIGSYAELKALSGIELEDYHRPWVDDVTFTINGIEYKRVPQVLDSWFEAGSMPYAQFHYPFENKDKFEQNFPGDFIAEYVGQVRAWFYYLHALSVGLFSENSFKNVIVTGTIAGNDGRKMSKSYGNYTDPNKLMDMYSADALRFLLLSSPLLNGEDFSLQDKDVSDVSRKLAMVWNMYDFFTLYASVDGWEWDGKLKDPYQNLTNPLDQWIVSRIHELTRAVDEHMQAYNLPAALAGILPFIDDASNWYVRRSRKRFWKSDNDDDKNDAYKTLHYVLVRLSLVMAPFTPFLAEELYRRLTGRESVHLENWPPDGQVNSIIIRDMAIIRHIISIGLSLRADNHIKVRQPLSNVTLKSQYKQLLSADLIDIIKDELNVKEVAFDSAQLEPDKPFLENLRAGNFQQLYKVTLDTVITDNLKHEGQARELIRFIQNARKKAGLQVDDRILLGLATNNATIKQAIDKFKSVIATETLALEVTESELDGHKDKLNLDGQEVIVTLKKATQ